MSFIQDATKPGLESRHVEGNLVISEGQLIYCSYTSARNFNIFLGSHSKVPKKNPQKKKKKKKRRRRRNCFNFQQLFVNLFADIVSAELSLPDYSTPLFNFLFNFPYIYIY